MHFIDSVWVANISALKQTDQQGAPPNTHLGVARKKQCFNTATSGSSPLFITGKME